MKRGTEKQGERGHEPNITSYTRKQLLAYCKSRLRTCDSHIPAHRGGQPYHDYCIIVVCNHRMVRSTVSKTVMFNIGRIPACTTGQCFQIQKQGGMMSSTHGLLHTALVSIKGHPRFMSNRFTVSGRSSFTHKLEDPHNTHSVQNGWTKLQLHFGWLSDPGMQKTGHVYHM